MIGTTNPSCARPGPGSTAAGADAAGHRSRAETPPSARDAAGPGDCHERQAQGDAFERALRRQAGGRGSERGSERESEREPAAEPPPLPGLSLWVPPAPPAGGAADVAAAAPAAGALPQDPSATAAAAGRAAAGTPVAPSLRSDASATWELSLRDPRGVALDLTATRGEALRAAGAPAAWTLSLAAPGLAAGALQPHLHRLHERLRSRALGEVQLRADAPAHRQHGHADDEGDDAA